MWLVRVRRSRLGTLFATRTGGPTSVTKEDNDAGEEIDPPEEVVADPKTGTKVVNREFTVTTRLAPPGTYKGRPENPANE